MYLTRILAKTRILNYQLSILSILLVSAIVINSGCSKNDTSTNDTSTNSTGNTPAANEIFIQGMAFSPANKTISIGTTIKWTNKESITHTVTSGVPGSPSGLFDSGNVGLNGVFSFTFSQAGTFKYYCKIHSSMTGTITVQ
jgi:plastocyanin